MHVRSTAVSADFEVGALQLRHRVLQAVGQTLAVCDELLLQAGVNAVIVGVSVT